MPDHVGVLATSLERARYINRTDPFLAKVSADLELLSVRSLGHRGRIFEAIFVDPHLWPLSDELIDEYGPCLAGSGGRFYLVGGLAIKSVEEQLHDLRQAVLAMATALGAALPHTPEVRATLNALADTPPPGLT
ncbi:hypothetical protein SEA_IDENTITYCRISIS_59 [Mycobacterium phage IdentityCrisis]|uniref:Uncharacterized protein n=1 Tax=Mycobacterium phage IdentityCrisis TaxID=2599866 RepID=A0A5J6TI45_9CAUD|nr:hypothetical protein QEH37_gp58 [Mycobacterium phage IdentityCrisis]QFG10078.1 hypothetical protein SEA_IDENTITYCRISIS_59 [Mycobacterium phage IdentityCrisis]